ncbi:hypothetical protein GCM10017608_27940 [Agromyces luteolus]|uniref:4'-phosphopantetheinyl transferase superfamily protein n=1 Tax=Agromyces luteolus TaxID=88373 RepID=A0A7C9HIN7_9MICO|nr:hypothetical protein [Agromyces luteolus]MUN06102.1 hypothetical protein [Agromyces luteolus]GLK28859.1 hypothetical protein GCM10017608_27940 [Agromyces luteolus]
MGIGRVIASGTAYSLATVAHGAAPVATRERLGPSDRARLVAARPDDAGRLLAGRAAALLAAARWTGSTSDDLIVDAVCPACGGPHGRPVVVGASAPVHVSIAHAAGVAFAVAAAVPVGVDAEPRSTAPARLAAVRDVLGRRSLAPLADWTAVEAILKADGRGLRVDPSEVVLGVGRRRGRVADRDARYRLRVRRDRSGCVVAVAWAEGAAAAEGPAPAGLSAPAGEAGSVRGATRRTGRPARHP